VSTTDLPLPLSFVNRCAADVRTGEDHGLFAFALIYAVAVCPFIGGVRGWPCTVGWLIAPALSLWQTRNWQGVGLGSIGSPIRLFRLAAAGVFLGVLIALGFFALRSRFPMLVWFTVALPGLHRSFVGGNVKLFIALIPIGHFVHELFYRGYLQTRLAARMSSGLAGILIAALLYAWTHVFIFSSPEFQLGMQSVLGGTGLGADNVRTTLVAVVAFSFVESIVAGTLLYVTKSIWPAISFRVANLVTLTLLLYPRAHLL
jgi:membrane protease YdiL (CAAX protease family)